MRRSKKIFVSTRGIVTQLLIFVLLLFFPFPAKALDSPHNSTNGMTCDRCHNSTKAAADPDWWKNQAANVCGQCHNVIVVNGTDVTTHMSGTKVLVQCTLCHDPHTQRQNRMWGTSSYLYSSTSDPYTGVTTTTVTKTGANWVQDQWKNMIVLPNVKYQGYSYRIVSNTADTLFIDTEGSAPDNNIDTIYCLPGDTFAIVYGKFVKENINNRLVRFFRDAGTNSFVDDTPTIDGVCQVCHTRTTSFRNTGILEGPGHPASERGRNCAGCHNHQGGFKASCKDCHGVPPVADTVGGPNGLATGNSDTGTGATTAGAHGKHAVDRKYVCETCHTGGMPESAVRDNKQIQIGFSIGSFATGTYDGRTSLANGYTYSSGNPGTTITQSGQMNCTVYCHSDGTALATGALPAVASPNWATGTISSCTACHQFPPAYENGVPKTNAHGSHAYSCNNCHNATMMMGNSITDSSKHLNAAYDVTPGAGKNFSYAFGSSGGTCSTVSCHSNTGTKWAASACLDCHSIAQGNRAAIGPQFRASSHHIQGATVTDLLCYQCHWEAKSDGSINRNTTEARQHRPAQA